MIYIISNSLLISGSFILLFWNLGDFDKKVLEKYFSYCSYVPHNDNNQAFLNKNLLQAHARDIIVKIFSFGYLLLGYISSIWSEKNLENYFLLFAITILTVILSFTGYWLSGFLSKKIYPEDKVVPYKETEEKYSIITSSTKKEVEKIFDEN